MFAALLGFQLQLLIWFVANYEGSGRY